MKRTSKKVSISLHNPLWEFIEMKGLLSTFAKAVDQFLKNFPTEKDPHFFHHTYSYQIGSVTGPVSLYIELFQYLDIDNDRVDNLTQLYWMLKNPDANQDPDTFKKTAFYLAKELKETDILFVNRLKKLTEIECIRLYEAMCCLKSDCHLSAVVMAVSAVEHRLHKLIRGASPKIYNQYFKEATLGGIIKLFQTGSYTDKKFASLKRLLPDKHRPLIEMLNIYRIFSAHPKEEIITHQTAAAILSLSFLLLVDDALNL